MNAEIKASWVSALKSGDYTQGKKCLRSGHSTFCCLGVLCALYDEAHGTNNWQKGMFMLESEALPREVYEWAGLKEGNPSVVIEGSRVSLIQLNDHKNKSFREIADVIDIYM